MARSDTELFKDKIEVSLDGRQIFFLFFGGAVIASLVFVLGVMVGKRVEARAHVERNAATSAALDPLSALDQLGAEERAEDLAFPTALTGGTAGAEMPLGSVDAKLTKAAEAAQKLAAAKPAEKGKKPAAEKPKSAEKPSAEEKARAKAEAKKAEQAKQAERAAADQPAVVESDKPAAGTLEEEEPAEAPAEKPKRKNYTLQLSSFQDRAEADAFHSQLTGAGYSPYIVQAEVEGKGTWFRVRLGKYDSYGAAIAAKKEFESKQKIIAYVTKVKR